MSRRRHLFDHGYPVSTATLLAGSQILLALSRQALRGSRYRLATSFLRLADSSGRLINTAGRCDCSLVQLRDSRDDYSWAAQSPRTLNRTGANRRILPLP
jgi:hypothetical protein